MKRIIIISLCLFALTSCTNLINETIYNKASAEESSTETINFIGNIQANGALPSKVFELVKNDQTRSALPTISNLSLFATATTSDGSLNSTGNFLENSNPIRFSISLSTGHTWTITCGLKTSNGAIVFSDSCQVTLTNDAPVFSYNFKPQITEGSGSGSVNLPISLESTNIDHITATCPSSLWNASIDDISSPSLVASDIPCGSYEVTLNFYEASNILKYSTTQYITVLNSLTTDTWISDESGLINDDGVFNLTNSLIDQYIRTIFYIGNTGLGSAPSDTNGSGSPYEPFESLSKAISVIASTGVSTKNYQIFISGTLTGKQTLTSNLDNKAASITIQGLNGLDENKIPQDCLNGNQTDTTLTVETSVPISIKNLKITGGKGANGGGLYLKNQSVVVKLLDGTLITENKATLGGGVYNTGTLFMAGSAMIGKSTSTIATSSSYGNKSTSYGAGICSISGSKIYLGYTSWTSSSVNSPSKLTGGVCGNYLSNSANPSSYGGGIYNKGQLYIDSGNISYNYAINGAGIYTESNITMTGGTIKGNEGNSSGNGGGVFVNNGSTFTMSGDSKILDNKNMNYGAGIYLYYNNCKLVMNGGEISGNIAETHGGAVYMHDLNSSSHSDLQISGSSYIPYGGAVNHNDIYMLDFNAKITITGSLSDRQADNLISITPNTYTEGTTLLYADSEVSLADEVYKFRVTPDSEGKEWSIDTNGNLSSHIYTYVTQETLANFSPSSSNAYIIIVDSSFGNTEVQSLLSKISGRVGEGTILDLSNSTATSISTSSSYWLHSGVSSITLPATLSSRLSCQFFQEANTLTEIIVPESNTIYSSQDGVLYTKDMTGLIKYPAAKEGDSFTLPETVYQLYYEAFDNNKNLKTINGLTQITGFINNDSDAVFSNCAKLEEIDLSGLTCKTLSAYTIRYSSALKKVTLSTYITTIDYACFQSLSNLEEVHFKTNTPPLIKKSGSDGYYKNFKSCSKVKFYVPSEAVEAYTNATGDNGICNPDYNGAADTTEGLQALIIGE